VYRCIQLFSRSVAAQIENERMPAGFQYAAHFLKRGYWMAEVLECGAAEQKVERLVGEWHCRGVALLKVDRDSGLHGIAACDFDEAAADVEPTDTIGTELRERDGEVTGTGRDFQHAAFRCETASRAEGRSFELIQRFLRQRRVPPGDETFHSNAL